MISHNLLKELLTYDPLTGIFTRNVNARRAKAGSVVGYKTKRGYVVICVNNKQYYAHILAYFYMKGVWFDGVLDHKNTIKHDNSWLNIREATSSLNNANANVRSDNALGVKGVTKFRSKYKAECKGKYLGLFNTIEEAQNAYITEAKKVFGEFARHS